ncbi:MAG: hypothetical protein V1784_03380 [bacterium]
MSKRSNDNVRNGRLLVNTNSKSTYPGIPAVPSFVYRLRVKKR